MDVGIKSMEQKCLCVISRVFHFDISRLTKFSLVASVNCTVLEFSTATAAAAAVVCEARRKRRHRRSKVIVVS